VLALGAGLDAAELVLDRVLDRLVVAKPKCRNGWSSMLAASVAAEQGVGADEVDGAGDPAAVALSHHGRIWSRIFSPTME
jgi:hypothetical protein